MNIETWNTERKINAIGKVKKYEIFYNTNEEAVRFMVRFAGRFKHDIDVRPNERFFDYIEFLKSRYAFEVGEEFSRPLYAFRIKIDCDDQLIFLLSIIRHFFPITSTFFACEYKDTMNNHHINLEVNGKVYDCLPFAWPPGVRLIKKYPIKGDLLMELYK